MFASGGNISRSGATSFCPRRQKDAKTPPKTNGFWISFCLIATAVQKGSASDSLYDEMRRSKSRVIHNCGFQRTPTAQEVLKPAVSSSVFGHFWGCGQK